MHQVKSDLICEIIRASQTNLLEKKSFDAEYGSDEYERNVMDWVRNNARIYREHFRETLAACSCSRLSEILKELTYTQKDLEEIFDGNQVLSDQKIERNSVTPEND